jgi:CRP/FNR family transcriptional regulator
MTFKPSPFVPRPNGSSRAGAAKRDPVVSVPLFQTLPAAERFQLAAVAAHEHYHKGQVVFQEGDPAQTVWFVIDGWVYLVKRTPRGEPATILPITPSEALCGLSAFEQSVYAASVVAGTETEVIRIPAAAFTRLLDRYPAFTRSVLLICCHRIRQMAEAISLASASVEQRLAHSLLRLEATFGPTIPITHQELARMAGTRWETSIRTLSTMKQRGWIESSRGQVVITHAAELRQLLKSAATRGGRDGSVESHGT